MHDTEVNEIENRYTGLWQITSSTLTFKDRGEEEAVVFDHSALATHLLTRDSFSILELLKRTSVPVSILELRESLEFADIETDTLPLLWHILEGLRELHLVEMVVKNNNNNQQQQQQ